MKFERGTPAFGIVLGVICAAAGALVMAIGFWRTVLLALLFAVGYFLGAVQDKSGFVRNVANKAIPQKKNETIDLRETLEREQRSSMAAVQGEKADEDNDQE